LTSATTEAMSYGIGTAIRNGSVIVRNLATWPTLWPMELLYSPMKRYMEPWFRVVSSTIKKLNYNGLTKKIKFNKEDEMSEITKGEIKVILENVACLGRDALTEVSGGSYVKRMTDYIMSLATKEQKPE